MVAPYDEPAWSEEAARRVWDGAVPLQVHLHDADVTSLPPPPPFLVHFRGYPAVVLSPCEGEDSVKWSYMNYLKESTFIITGNSKSVMNMSQTDQAALWESVMKGNMDGYKNISTKLKIGPFEEDGLLRMPSAERQLQQSSDEPESPGSGKPCRVPIRLYVRSVEDIQDLEDALPLSNWETVSYINRPFEIQKAEGGSYITLEHALKTLLPEFFSLKSAGRAGNNSQALGAMDSAPDDSATINSTQNSQEAEPDSTNLPEEDVAEKAKVKLVRVQGIELGMDIPFLWVANNLKNPEYYLHVCVYVGSRKK